MKISFVFYSVSILFFTSYGSVSSEDVATSVFDVTRLVRTQESLAGLLQQSIESAETRVEQLRQLSENQQHWLSEYPTHDRETFFSHPVTSYLFIKRLAQSMEAAKSLTETPLHVNLTDKLLEDLNGSASIPGPEDTSDAIDSLIRLHETYQLNLSSLMSGKIELPDGKVVAESPNGYSLSIEDVIHMGIRCIEKRWLESAVTWLEKGLKMQEEASQNERHLLRITIIENLAYAHYLLTNMSVAINLNEELIRIESNTDRLDHLYRVKESWEKETRELELLKQLEPNLLSDNSEAYANQAKYIELCRGDTKSNKSTLLCYYWPSESPYMKLMHIKAEQHSESGVFQFYDVIHDSEIEWFLSQFELGMRRATAGGGKTVDFRIGKFNWFRRHIPLVRKIHQRIEDITGLNLRHAEAFQVLNYGIGGHYEHHYDVAVTLRERKMADSNSSFYQLNYVDQQQEIYSDTSHRLATWMFYLSDVIYGGDTVFIKSDTIVKPVKGSAVFWYNLMRNGSVDYSSMHAGCPVLTGSKWVANQWKGK